MNASSMRAIHIVHRISLMHSFKYKLPVLNNNRNKEGEEENREKYTILSSSGVFI